MCASMELRRMSYSTRSMEMPETATADARSIKTKALPSLGMEDVIAMTQTESSTLMKRMLAKRVCATFETA